MNATTEPTIREATRHDADDLDRLLRAQRLPGAHAEHVAIGTVPGRRHVLVLDGPDGGLAAAALVCIEGPRGHLAMLAVAPDFEGSGIEARMIGVAEALCRAFGADTLDVPVRRAA